MLGSTKKLMIGIMKSTGGGSGIINGGYLLLLKVKKLDHGSQWEELVFYGVGTDFRGQFLTVQNPAQPLLVRLAQLSMLLNVFMNVAAMKIVSFVTVFCVSWIYTSTSR